MDKSQVISNTFVLNLVKLFGVVHSIDDVIRLKDFLYNYLVFRTVENKKDELHEKTIRWRRTGIEILQDTYVYKGKACTDIVIAFITFLNALEIKNSFLKVKKGNYVHSMVELYVGDKWYIYDVSSQGNNYLKGRFSTEMEWNGWKLWKKGRDSWDIGLHNYDDIEKILK